MARIVAAFAVVAFVVSAGCTSPDSLDDDVEDEAMAGVEGDVLQATPPRVGAPRDDAVSLVQYGCIMTFGAFVVPEEYANLLMPAGIEPITDAGTATFGVKSWRCENSVAEGVDVPTPASVVYYVRVQPVDPALERADARVYWFPIVFFSSSKEEQLLYARWNFGEVVGAPVNVQFDPAGALPLGRTDARGDGNALELDLTLSGGSASRGFIARYFGAKDGVVTHAVDITVTPHRAGGGGPALLRVDGPMAPQPGIFSGSSSSNQWESGEVSYEWRVVSFAPPS